MINVLYIAVGEGGSDQALITLIKELKCKIRPYIILGKLASQSTIDKLKSENIPYSILLLSLKKKFMELYYSSHICL